MVAKPAARGTVLSVNSSPLSIGVAMVLYGLTLSAFSIHALGRVGPLTLAVSAALVTGGIALLVRKPLSFWIGLGAAIFTFAAGLASMKLPPASATPYPVIVIIIGLYACLRVTMTRNAFGPKPPRRNADVIDTK